MSAPRSFDRALKIGVLAAVFLGTAGVALVSDLVLALGAGLAILVVGMAVLTVRARAAALNAARAPDRQAPPDPGRRTFLAGAAAGGLGLVVAGAAGGTALKRFVRPDPAPILEGMAGDVGAEYMELIRRGYHPARSGDLQLIVAPGSSSIYPQEATSLVFDDPRTSHSQVWNYLERIPIALYAPGIVAPSDSTERVTLADLAPTTAMLMGFDFPAADGSPLPGIEAPVTPPKVIVTFVIDGGGWNVLAEHPGAWPNIARMLGASAVYRNAIVGSFPAVTACAHATIGTGAFPYTHGISGHNVRIDGQVVKAYGAPGEADPSFLLSPTLAEAWSQETGDGAWVGEIGYQIWHMGMLGKGGDRPLGDLPIATYWPETGANTWASLNPDLYRLPNEVPPIEDLLAHQERYTRIAPPPSPYDLQGVKEACCTPPIVSYQGDLIEAAFRSEPIGQDDITDLLYINFKSPDYAGHVYNFTDERTGRVLSEVDQQLGRLLRLLEDRFAPGEYAVILTADHGQCPPIDEVGGVRVDPIQLDEDVDTAFSSLLLSATQSVVPHEIYLDANAMLAAGWRAADVAAWLGDYRYRDNIGEYVPRDLVQRDRLSDKPFAAVFPVSYLESLQGRDLAPFGDTAYPEADPGLPPITW
ncbi:MAG: alkaline phosphatase family protein [Actinomycetota bacterium]